MIGSALTAFFAMVALDYVWGRYVVCISDKRAVAASGFASAITLFNGLVVLALVEHWWILFPAAAGAFVGTWLSVRGQ